MSTSLVLDTPLRQVQTVKDLLSNKNAAQQLASVAAKHLNPERMMRSLANAARTTPKLLECDPMSLLGGLMSCAAMGLEPNTPLGHAYLIPFRNNRKGITEVQLIAGYKGYADMAFRSGRVKALHADVVYEDDELWSYEYGTDTHLRHKPGPREGKMIAAYCYAKLEDGQAFGVLPLAHIIKVRDKSQGWQSAVKFGKTADNPWSTHFDRMAAKTALRALAQAGELPMSIEFQDLFHAEENRMDYRAFAANPDAGLVPASDDMIDHDPETGEVVETKHVENKPGVTMPAAERKDPAPRADPMAAAREKARAAAEAKAKAAPAATTEKVVEQAAPATAEATAAPTEPEEEAPNYAGLYQKIMDDVIAVDAAEAFVALEPWEDALAKWAEADPQGHAMLMDAVAEREASGKKAGE